MMFRSVVSMITGFVVIWIIVLGVSPIAHDIHNEEFFIFLLACLCGGFIATYFSREIKIRYSIYVGLFFAVTIFVEDPKKIELLSFLILPFFTGIGGVLGKITDKNGRQAVKTRSIRNFHPLITIILGTVVTILSYITLGLITGLTSFGPIFIIATFSFIVGGFAAVYLDQEKKIIYGVCAGIITILIISVIDITKGSASHDYYIWIGKVISFSMAAIVGGYLAKIIDKHLKQNTEKKIV